MIVVKKYSNRRLYDTAESRYITLEELAAKVRDGTDVQVVDAKSGRDLTQATLTQIIIDGRGAAKLLPVPLLTQLIRMQDEALAEFLGKYLSTALELYLSAKRGAQALNPYVPLSTLPFSATDALARLLAAAPLWPSGPAAPPAAAAAPPPPEPASAPDEPQNEIAELRRELEELKRALGKSKE
jgi:polyhydroxyalkanoate synthesis repressor PhaR